MSKVKNNITTGEATAIFNVDPDTVLRWIKSDEIPAISTPGGHYRINRNVFLTKMIRNTTIKEKNETRPILPYCWQYYSEEGIIRNACKDCIVYKCRASRCYEFSILPASIGYSKRFCSDSCED